MRTSTLLRLCSGFLLLACAADLWGQAQQRATTTTRTTAARAATGGARLGTGGYPSPTAVGEAIVTSDPETRRLIVITDEETAEAVSQVISNLDRPKPQVLIKVTFLEATYRDGFDFGIQGSRTKNIGGNTTMTVDQAFRALTGGPTSGALNFGFLGADWEVTLRAIAEGGKLEVLSRPTILARNNQQAVIVVGQQVPLITATRYDNFGNQINSITYENVGIILRVTPFITSEDLVEMIISPEISALSEQSVAIASGTNAAAAAPVINIRSADTVVVTPNGQTVVIGGLMQKSKMATESKVPILGDIPLLGHAFKRKVQNDAKTELLIFLTPYIIKDPTELIMVSDRERTGSETLPRAFNEPELNRFLDSLPVKSSGSGVR
ncbi:type II secretion system protein GspD [Limisphaera sp. VF-2]|jgi:general secretion pathway protein D|uniref:type II secretion system protein GspD n=1 Tax=Limisphaera sp. VF-2 TaxID=3400418 RepID=UPI003C200939